MSETSLVRQALLELSSGATRMFRNNCGTLRDDFGRYVKYGIANPGGSDLIGFTTVTITPDMVGREMAIFCAVECKFGRGRPTEDQRSFVEMVNGAGGRAGIAYSVSEAKKIISG